MYKYLVLRSDVLYFVRNHFDSKTILSEIGISKTLCFLKDNMFVTFRGHLSFNKQSAFYGKQLCPLLSDSFLIHTRLASYRSISERIRRSQHYPLTSRSAMQNNVLSLNNSNFVDYVEHIYLIKLQIKIKTDTGYTASHLLHLEIHNESRFFQKLNDKNYSSFIIVIFFISFQQYFSDCMWSLAAEPQLLCPYVIFDYLRTIELRIFPISKSSELRPRFKSPLFPKNLLFIIHANLVNIYIEV